jgi:hypothetical protein
LNNPTIQIVGFNCQVWSWVNCQNRKFVFFFLFLIIRETCLTIFSISIIFLFFFNQLICIAFGIVLFAVGETGAFLARGNFSQLTFELVDLMLEK